MNIFIRQIRQRDRQRYYMPHRPSF